MNLLDDPAQYMRQVRMAQWRGQEYSITLECGHLLHCSANFLSANMFCVQCLKTALNL